jgi:uncharacterized membrane protein
MSEVRRPRCELESAQVLTKRVASLGLGAGAILWVAALWLAPAIVFPVGRFICHQRPERSFVSHGQQLPVCARCTGLYVGAALAAPIALAATTLLAGARARRWLGLAALPTVVTWTLEFAGIAPLSNTLRFVAALPLGFVAAWLVLSVIAED